MTSLDAPLLLQTWFADEEAIDNKKRNQSIEEIEAIVDRKLAQRDADKDAKTDAERNGERYVARDAVRDAVKDVEIEVESDVEREASNEGRVQKRRKQSSYESMTVVHRDKEKLKDIKEPKLCMLFSPYTEDSTPIACGMVYPIGDGTIHGGPRGMVYRSMSLKGDALCNQQQDDSNSGYYVMRWMYDFVNICQLHFPTTTDQRQLVEKDIDRTVEQWHAMCPI
ncbi:hypothetical protein Tco_0152596 [Tanacetum coccineum]